MGHASFFFVYLGQWGRNGLLRPGAQFFTVSLSIAFYFFVLSCMAASAASSSPQEVDSESFIFHVTLFLLAALGAVVLFRLPRGIALFGSDDWRIGHILCYIPYRPPRSTSRSRRIIRAAHTTRGLATQPPSPTPQRPSHDVASDESHTLANHQQAFKRVDSMGRPIEMQYPTHIASCPSFLRWTLPLLRHRITPNHSFGQVIVLTAYSWILIYATLYKSNFFLKYNRVGWVSIGQLPFVLAYGAKNNVVGTFLGVGYKRVCPTLMFFSFS